MNPSRSPWHWLPRQRRYEAGEPPAADGTICDHLPSGMQRVLARLGDVPVAVFAADWQLVRWNHGWAALLGAPLAAPPRMRNFTRDRFPVGADHTPLALWPVTDTDPDTTDAALVSDLRRATGRFPRDTRLAALVHDLNVGNERFAELWAKGEVTANREVRKTVDHPSVGPVTVDCDVLTDGDTELKIVIMTATPGSEDEAKLQLTTVVGPPSGTRN